jgi:hypothetical protein
MMETDWSQWITTEKRRIAKFPQCYAIPDKLFNESRQYIAEKRGIIIVATLEEKQSNVLQSTDYSLELR